MKRLMSRGSWFVVGTLIATSGIAEEYDFEIGLAYDRSSFNGSQLITNPGGTIFSSTDIDTDELNVFGSWYFAGMSDDVGPRARAVFVDRASSLSFGYSHLELSSLMSLVNNDPSFPFPSVDSRFDLDADSLAVNMRYVNRDSGWIGNAGVLTSDASLRGQFVESSDTTGWSLGVGKYLYDTTALSVNLSEVNGEGGNDASVIAVDFTHLSDLGERWQYAVDLGFSRTDSDSGLDLDTWDATLAFYPTRDFEFGINIEDVSPNQSTFFDLDTTAFEGFASWYVTPNVQLSARYRTDDVSYVPNPIINAPSVRDADQNSFGISATVRF